MESTNKWHLKKHTKIKVIRPFALTNNDKDIDPEFEHIEAYTKMVRVSFLLSIDRFDKLFSVR